MTVEDLRDELDRVCKQGAGHLPVKVEMETITVTERVYATGQISEQPSKITECEDVPVVDLHRVNSRGTFLCLITYRGKP